MTTAGTLRSSGWSLDPNAWNELANLLSQRQSGCVKFIAAFTNNIPQSPGVYIFCLSPLPESKGFIAQLYNSVYVGQATNLRQRFKNHLDGKTSVEPILRSFTNLDYWHISCDKDELDWLEKRLYDVLNPMSNKVSPPFRAKLNKSISVNP